MKKKATAQKQLVEEKSQPLFVGLTQPIPVYKGILEVSKAHVSMLQCYQKVKTVRTQKAKYIAELNKKLAEIKKLLFSLYDLLPNHEIAKRKKAALEATVPQPKKSEPLEKFIEKPVEQKVVKQVGSSSEMAKLEAELAAIERKLADL